MEKYLEIISAEYLKEYKIIFTFNNKKNVTIDFYPFLKKETSPHIKPYLNKNKFKNFKISGGDIQWNEFEMCYRPEIIYNWNRYFKNDYR